MDKAQANGTMFAPPKAIPILDFIAEPHLIGDGDAVFHNEIADDIGNKSTVLITVIGPNLNCQKSYRISISEIIN